MKHAAWYALVLAALSAVLPAVLPAQQAVTASASAPVASSSVQAAHAPAGGAISGRYIIGADDVLAISVWKEPDVSRTLPVRSDGRISLPLVGEVQASGRTPNELQADIQQRLKAYLADPEVTVIVQEARSQTFNVVGEVFRPGSYRLTKPTNIVDAIAMAGGFRDFAKRKSVYVLRTRADGSQMRMPVNYNDVIRGRVPQQNVLLQAGDSVVVP
jgi:polysaccharide export outer membrane protein